MATTSSALEDSIGRRTHSPLSYLLNRQTFWVFVALLCALAWLAFLSPRSSNVFDTPQNLFNVARNCAFVGIIALGMTAVIITGGIDLSVGSIVALAGMVTGMFMSGKLPVGEWPVYAAIAAGLSAAVFAGMVNGLLIAYLGMPAFVVTLGMMSVARSVAMVLSNNQMVYQFGFDHKKLVAIGGGSTRGWFTTLADLFGPDTALGGFFLWLSDVLVVPNPAIFLVLFALLFGFAFRWSKWGRYIFAIGGNEQAATLTGVPVRTIKVSVYMLSALMAGIAGILLVGWLGTITTGMGLGYELNAIAAVVIGGASLSGGSGTAFGAVIGAVLFEVIRNSLTLEGINPFWQGTFIGGFIIFALLFDRLRELGAFEALIGYWRRLRGDATAG